MENQESTLPADSIMVGIEKEGCLLKDVWQMLDYNDTTNSDLFNLLNECAAKKSIGKTKHTLTKFITRERPSSVAVGFTKNI